MRPIILPNMNRFRKANLTQSTCLLVLFVFKSIKLNNSTKLWIYEGYNRSLAVWIPCGIPKLLAVGCNFTFWRSWNLKLRRLTAVSHHQTLPVPILKLRSFFMSCRKSSIKSLNSCMSHNHKGLISNQVPIIPILIPDFLVCFNLLQTSASGFREPSISKYLQELRLQHLVHGLKMKSAH